MQITRFAKVGHLCQLRACEPHGDGAEGTQPRAHGALGAGDHGLGDGAVVVHRLGVGHAAHGGETARRRRSQARRDVFLVLFAGLPEVDVQVHEAGEHPLPGQFQRGHAIANDALGGAHAHAGNAAVLHDHVTDRVPLIGGVEDASTA